MVNLSSVTGRPTAVRRPIGAKRL